MALRACLALFLCFIPGLAAAQDSPAKRIGHKVGADFKLASWTTIADYFQYLSKASSRVNTRLLGQSTEGRPFLLVEISSEKNLKQRARLIAQSRQVADPRRIPKGGQNKLVANTPAIVSLACSLHSSEVAASQMSMELAWRLATSNDAKTREILENCVILLFPSQNPDGNDKIRDWYRRSLGKAWEGRGMPWLYQKYAGHDNNRDWFMLNLKETRLVTKVLYTEWAPTIYYDIHQMGNSGARFFVPPFHDPINPNLDPVINQWLMVIGGHMSKDLLGAGKRGVITGAIYDNWWAGGNRTTPQRHNIVALLTEAASANIASPIFQRRRDLRGGRRGMPDYQPAVNFPAPWHGGWWRLRDIVDYELIACHSLLTLAARYRKDLLNNQIKLGFKQLRLGQRGNPYAWILPENQRDPERAAWLVDVLQQTGIEAHTALEDLKVDGVTYPKGSTVLYAAQPFRPHLKDMMERQLYPTRYEYPGGPAEAPYDMAGWTLPLQLGVQSVTVARPFKAKTKLKARAPMPRGITSDSPRSLDEAVFFLSKNQRLRDQSLVFELQSKGIALFLTSQPITVDEQQFPAGSLVIAGPRYNGKGASAGLLKRLTESYQVALWPTLEETLPYLQPLRPVRLALYQPWTASMDEGWTRLVFETFKRPYTSIHNDDIRAGGDELGRRFDVIVIPSIRPKSLLNGRARHETAREYSGGLGTQGLSALQSFVEQGGHLIVNDRACDLFIDHFKLPITNLTRGKSRKQFYCAGSILRLQHDTAHPLSYGVPDRGVGFFTRSQAFKVHNKASIESLPKDQRENARKLLERYPTEVPARYADSMVLLSGWIHNPELIAGAAATTQTRYGKGSVVLFGFRVQHRAQPQATFRLLFNAILRAGLKVKEKKAIKESPK